MIAAHVVTKRELLLESESTAALCCVNACVALSKSGCMQFCKQLTIWCLQVSSEDKLTADPWQLLTGGHVLKPSHATALHLALPYRAWLSAVGMQLVAHSTRTIKTLAPNSFVMSGSISDTTDSSSSYKKDAFSISASGKGSTAFNSKSSQHQCWQPVLVAYGSDSSSQELMSSGREVLRSSPAALSLWAIEAYGKDVLVLSDPACFLQLR